ncbi:MAG TPA: hypothetical protein VES42_27920, partial [Pilimelia sp.]|nr:hypothetical protein [Pilimelia sp.]
MLDVESPVGTWFGTDFDEPPPTLSVPGVLAGGQEPALRASDHFVRGHRVVGRFGAAESMIGLKVRAGGLPVRVTAHLRLDSAALTWWAERADPRAVAAAAGPERPRLVLVSSQGRPRGAALLARARVGAQAVDARAVVAFALAAEEVPDDGLLLLDATDPTPRL